MGGWNTIYASISNSLAEHTRTLARMQEQISSGKRIIRASDAPGDAYRTLRLRSQSDSIGVYCRNVEDMVRSLEMSESVLMEISNGTTRVKQLLTQAASDVLSLDQRAAIAREIDSLLEQFVSLANTNTLGRYLFGGAVITQPPLAVQRTGGSITDVLYQGSLNELQVPVAPGLVYPGVIVGTDAFWSDDRQEPEFLGTTGAAAGSATSTVRGDAYLLISHTQTNYAGGSGLQPGTSSPAGDTVLGDHVLTVAVAGPVQTISLDGGPAVEFLGTEQDLKVSNGTVTVYVDTTGWVGFTGDVDITGEGRMTIDDGASFTDVTSFTDNLVVTHADTGKILYVDTTDLARTGTEPVRVPGTYDLFGTLINIRDLLLQERGLPQQLQHECVQRTLDSLDETMGTLTNTMTVIGGRFQAIDGLKQSLTGVQATADDQAAMLQDADVVQVATQMARAQTLYEMTLAVASKLLGMSLLDYI